MSNTKNDVEFKQTSMDLSKAIQGQEKREPKVVQAVKPTPKSASQPTQEKREPKHYVDGEVLTEKDLEKMSPTERENYLEEKRLANVEKMKNIKYHARDLRKKYQRTEDINSNQPEDPELDGVERDEFCDEFFYDSTSKNRQKNVCKKYHIKQRDLRKGVEVARKLFVPAMMKTEKQSVVMAICDLLEFGDLPGRNEK